MTRFLRSFALLLISFSLTACDGLFSNENQAPNVSFQDLQGVQYELNDFKGKVVFLKFWTTDCTTCVAQMPDNIAYQEEYGPQGFEVIAIALKHDPIEYVRNFSTSRQLPFIVASDTNGEIAQAFGNVRMTPTAFLIDKNGRIVKRYLGPYDKDSFKQTLDKALRG